MQMIRHQQKNVRPPQELFLPVPDGFKQADGNFWQGKLVVTAFPAVDGDEINLPVRVNPQGHVMRQGFSSGPVHAPKVFANAVGWQTKNGRDRPPGGPRRRAQRQATETGGVGLAARGKLSGGRRGSAGQRTAQRAIPTLLGFGRDRPPGGPLAEIIPNQKSFSRGLV